VSLGGARLFLCAPKTLNPHHTTDVPFGFLGGFMKNIQIAAPELRFPSMLALAALVLLVLTLSSCKDMSLFGPDHDDRDSDPIYALTLPDAEALPGEVSDATPMGHCRSRGPESDRRRIGDFGARFLRRIPNLTDSQKTIIKQLHAQHEECFRAAVANLRASDSTIVAGFAPQFDSIKAELALGTIDSAAARTALRELSAAVRTAVRNNPDRVVAADALKACRDAFLAAVREILTDEQKAAFDAWAASHRR
jgi:hypothetical protein